MPGARRRPGHPTIALVLGPMCSGQALRRRSARPSWSGAAEAGRDGPRRRRLVLAGEFVVADMTRALWFDVAGAALVSAAYPSLQAARLGIMPARLSGRAESVRTLHRGCRSAGVRRIGDLVAGIVPRAGSGRHAPRTRVLEHGDRARVSFLIMLAALAVAGVVLLRARRTTRSTSSPLPPSDASARA
jgi:hypothetical protein